MRLAVLFLALALTACEDGAEPPTTVEPDLEVGPDAGLDSGDADAANDADWTGTWSWDETWPGSGGATNVLSYTLILGELDGDLEGGLALDGYQTMKSYEVRGVPRGDTLIVTVSGYGDGHTGSRDDLGDRLFSLVDAGDGTYTTVWDALRPAVGEDEAQAAFSKE